MLTDDQKEAQKALVEIKQAERAVGRILERIRRTKTGSKLNLDLTARLEKFEQQSWGACDLMQNFIILGFTK